MTAPRRTRGGVTIARAVWRRVRPRLRAHARGAPQVVARTHGDDGNVSILTLGWAVLALMAMVVMVAATQLHVDRMRLSSVADELALAAADELDASRYFSGAGGIAPSEAQAHEAVVAWLAADPRDWAGEVEVLDVHVGADGTVTVRIGREVVPLIDAAPLADHRGGIALAAEGRARIG